MPHCFDGLPKSVLTGKPVLHFVHANGFVAKVYTPLFDIWQRHFSLEVIELFGTHDTYPIDEHWQSLTNQVIDNIEKSCQKHGVDKLVAVGHSLGATTTLQAMDKDPSHISQTVLLDPALLMGKQSLLCQLAKYADKIVGHYHPHYFVDKINPAGKSKYRRDVFNSRQEAYQNLKDKGLFRQFDKRCFDLYIEHGIVEQGDKLTLAIAKALELAIFRTIPSQYWWQRPVIYRPSTIIAGENSYFTHIQSYQQAQRKWQIPLIDTQGSHMFVLEYPDQTAKLVLETIANQIKPNHRNANK